MTVDVKSPVLSSTRHHLKENYRLHLEVGFLSALILVAGVLNFYPKTDPAHREIFIPQVSVEVIDIPQTLQPISTKGVPIKPVIPVASAKMQEVLIDDTDLIFGSEDGLLTIPAPPNPPGKKKTAEYFPPKLMVSKFPEYPKELQKKGIRGMVVLEVQVDTDGKVINHRVKQNTTGSDLLEQLAIETVYKCRYNPASDGTKAIQAWTDHRFEFRENSNH